MREELVVKRKGILLRFLVCPASFVRVYRMYQEGERVQRSPGSKDRRRFGLTPDVELHGLVDRKRPFS